MSEAFDAQHGCGDANGIQQKGGQREGGSELPTALHALRMTGHHVPAAATGGPLASSQRAHPLGEPTRDTALEISFDRGHGEALSVSPNVRTTKLPISFKR
jgi:hypothetical protein